jgi:hypothetical protein
MKSSILIPILNRVSMLVVSGMDSGLIRDDKPKMKKILKRFDPTTFPIAKSTFLFLTAVIDVASSGRDVPMDTMVNAITLSEIPIFLAN